MDIQPYVLRYWQTEFPLLASRPDGHRNYDAEGLEIVRRIKELLYDEGYTIASAKKKLAAELDEGGLRGKTLAAAEAIGTAETGGNGDEPAQQAETDDSTIEELPEAPETGEAIASSPAVLEASGVGEIGALTRRVEKLEGGVAALVTQARRLAAELKPEAGIEDE